MKALVFCAVVLLVGMWAYEARNTTPPPAKPLHGPYVSDHSNESDSFSRDAIGSPDSSRDRSQSATFDGYACTVDCSGHEAGYRWAEEHGIDDEDACEAAADHSNSPSFGEGCKAYVNGKPDDESSDDSSDDQ